MNCVAHETTLFMGFSSQKYWTALPFPVPGMFLIQGLNPHLLQVSCTAGEFFTIELPLSHWGSQLDFEPNHEFQNSCGIYMRENCEEKPICSGVRRWDGFYCMPASICMPVCFVE